MEKFDAIVVGAGPAGCAAAYTMAKAGVKVLVFERGKYAGAKNMWGGAFFGPLMHEMFPDFWKEAPVERFINRHVIGFLTPEDSLSVDFKSASFANPPYNGFITLRAKFDRWLAGKVEEVGALLATSLEVDDLILECGVVKGVKMGPEEFPADVVIAADGVNSLLPLKAGLRKEFTPRDMKQGVKEVIRLSQPAVDERFNLKGDEGVAMEFVGSCTRGLPGGGFLYTNKDSISVGVVVQLEALLEHQVKASDLIEDFKNHPSIREYLRDGQIVEYSAHLIPVSGMKMMPRLLTDGMLVAGDAAAMVLGTGLILEGANLAMASGIAAGQAVIKAKEKGDFSQASLQPYEDLLREQFVLKDLQTFKGAPEFLENKKIYTVYPNLACDMARQIFHNDGKPRPNTYKTLMKGMRGRVSLWEIMLDAWKARSAI